MTPDLGSQLEKLRALSTELNDATEQTARVVQAVEDHLNASNLGVSCRVVVSEFVNEDEMFRSTTYLMYDRWGGRYRVFIRVSEWNVDCTDVNDYLWANARRELRLAAFPKLPELLASLIALVEDTVASIAKHTSSIAAVVPLDKTKVKRTAEEEAGE